MEEPEELTFQFLREITDGFSEEQKVGEGAFGEVYRGVTKNGQDVAVKILRDDGKDLDYRQFRNEFYNLSKVRHNNIVQVIGYCYEIEPVRIEYYGRIVLAEKTTKHSALSICTMGAFKVIFLMSLMDLIGIHGTKLLREHVKF